MSELAPMEAAPHRTVVTAIPAVTARRAEVQPPVLLPLSSAAPTSDRDEHGSTVELDVRFSPMPVPRSAAQPLTADLRRLHVTVSKRFMAKVEAARDALSHSHPGADVEQILEAGLDLLLERAAKRKGLVKRPRSTPSAVAADCDPRQVPAAVRREVFLRDDGHCQWPTVGGGICGSTHRVELDHVVPVGRGGRATVANLRVLCDTHNALAARQVFGDEFMGRFRPILGASDRQPAAPR